MAACDRPPTTDAPYLTLKMQRGASAQHRGPIATYAEAHLDPGDVINFYQAQALACRLEVEVQAMLGQVDDDVLRQEVLFTQNISNIR